MMKTGASREMVSYNRSKESDSSSGSPDEDLPNIAPSSEGGSSTSEKPSQSKEEQATLER